MNDDLVEEKASEGKASMMEKKTKRNTNTNLVILLARDGLPLPMLVVKKRTNGSIDHRLESLLPKKIKIAARAEIERRRNMAIRHLSELLLTKRELPVLKRKGLLTDIPGEPAEPLTMLQEKQQSLWKNQREDGLLRKRIVLLLH